MRGFAHPKPLSPCTSRKTTTTTTCRERRLKKDSLSPTATRASYAAIKDASRVWDSQRVHYPMTGTISSKITEPSIPLMLME